MEEEEEVCGGMGVLVDGVMVVGCELCCGDGVAEVVMGVDEDVEVVEFGGGEELLEGVGGDWGGVVTPGTSWYT